MSLRQKVEDKIVSILSNDQDLEEQVLNQLSRQIERSIFNKTVVYARDNMIPRTWDSGRFQRLYAVNSRHILVNLDPKSFVQNKDLKQKIIQGTIPAKRIAQLEPMVTHPEIWTSCVEELTTQNKYKYETRTDLGSDMFTCPKCKGKKTHFYQKQTRAADEPMTTFVNCLICQYSWKF